VWDKGKPPDGVQNDLIDDSETATGATAMADEKEDKAAADKARHDAETEKEAKFDSMMDAIRRMDARMDAMADKARHDAAKKDKFGKRKDGESFKDYSDRHDSDMRSMMDALRKDSEKSEEDCMADAVRARSDAEEEEKRHDKDFEKWAKEEGKEPEHKEDKAKKDAEAPEDKKEEAKEEKAEKEEEKSDSRKDAAMQKENAELRMRLAKLEGTIKNMTAETSPSDLNELASAQGRADSVAAMFGDRAPAPIPGEKPVDYRKRLLSKFQRHSPAYNGVKFDAFDPLTLGLVEERVYSDAMTTARTTNDA
jgi:hypothetical protein